MDGHTTAKYRRKKQGRWNERARKLTTKEYVVYMRPTEEE